MMVQQGGMVMVPVQQVRRRAPRVSGPRLLFSASSSPATSGRAPAWRRHRRTLQVMMVMAPQFQWASGPMDMCAGGAGLCLYATCCTPCAAGEVAVAADRSYAMACCVAPLLGHLAHSDALRDLIEACFWMVRGPPPMTRPGARALPTPLLARCSRPSPPQGDRRALVQKYGIDDSELNQPCQLPSAFCLMTCCPQCLLVQVSWRRAGRHRGRKQK